MIEWEPDVARYKQVAAIIRARIEDGTYPPRARIPSVVDLLEEFGISTSTGQKVHRALREEGLTHTEPGIGTFVAKAPAARPRDGA